MIQNPDLSHTDDDNFTYIRYDTTSGEEAALEKWIRDKYDINDYKSKKNPNYNLGPNDCRSFRNDVRNQLEKIIRDGGSTGRRRWSTGKVPKAQ